MLPTVQNGRRCRVRKNHQGLNTVQTSGLPAPTALMGNNKTKFLNWVTLQVDSLQPYTNERYQKITWLRLLAVHTVFTDIGSLWAVKIDRVAFGRDFYTITERERGMNRFACTFFDEMGRFNTKYLEDPFHKGLGIWGDEMKRGNIFLIKEVNVVLQQVGIPPSSLWFIPTL
jgi:hypothetical protein